MKKHPSEDALLDLVLGQAGPDVRAHAAECPECAGRVAEAGQLLSRIGGVDVPEPAPPFWSEFRRDVRSRIAEGAPVSVWQRWLVPVAALAAAAVFVVAVHPIRPSAPVRPNVAAPTLEAWAPLPAAENDAALSVLEGLVLDDGAVEWDEGRGLGTFLAGLTDDESAALARALRQTGQEGAL